MDTNELIRQLTEERNRIDAVIKLLSGTIYTTAKYVEPKTRKPMSAAARKRIAAAQKKRWAARRDSMTKK
jgi:hypothetical protein